VWRGVLAVHKRHVFVHEEPLARNRVVPTDANLNSFCPEPTCVHGVLSHRIICAYYQPHTKSHLKVTRFARKLASLPCDRVSDVEPYIAFAPFAVFTQSASRRRGAPPAACSSTAISAISAGLVDVADPIRSPSVDVVVLQHDGWKARVPVTQLNSCNSFGLTVKLAPGVCSRVVGHPHNSHSGGCLGLNQPGNKPQRKCDFEVPDLS
jgi:hypothetical protein